MTLLAVLVGAVIVGLAFVSGQRVQSDSLARQRVDDMRMAELQAETTIRLAGLAHQGRPRPERQQVAPMARVHIENPAPPPPARPIRSIGGHRRPTS